MSLGLPPALHRTPGLVGKVQQTDPSPEQEHDAGHQERRKETSVPSPPCRDSQAGRPNQAGTLVTKAHLQDASTYHEDRDGASVKHGH